MLAAYLRRAIAAARLFAPLALLLALAASAGDVSLGGAGRRCAVRAAVAGPVPHLGRPRRPRTRRRLSSGPRPRAGGVGRPDCRFQRSARDPRHRVAIERDGSGIAVAVLTLLIFTLGAWYLLRTGRTAAGDHLLLSKYPAMVVVIAGERAGERSGLHPGLGTGALLRGLRLRALARPGESALDRRTSMTSLASSAHWADPVAATAPPPPLFEAVSCYLCGSTDREHFITAEDDLGGTPGTFASCAARAAGSPIRTRACRCEHIGAYYDDQLHRASEEAQLGPADAALRAGDEQARRDRRTASSRATWRSTQAARCSTSAAPSAPSSPACDDRYGVPRSGRRLQGSVSRRTVIAQGRVPLRTVLRRAARRSDRFDLVTMWHFLEHDYDPLRSLRDGASRAEARRHAWSSKCRDSTAARFAWFGDRWPGLQAPQHTVLFDRDSLLRAVRKCGPRGGRLPAVRRVPRVLLPVHRRGVPHAEGTRPQPRPGDRAVLRRPVADARRCSLFERRLNLAMQTVVCRRAS